MKINYKNTCLDFLDNPEKMGFHIPDNNHFEDLSPESWKFAYSVRDAFSKLVKADSDRPIFREKIRLISMPFWNAYLKAKSSLKGVFTKEPLDETGTFITQVPGMTHTYFYYIRTSGQPYGPGMKERRLQWIEPFEKTGYTRKAKIL